MGSPEADHYGSTTYWIYYRNRVPACGKCNQSKGKAHWHDWMMSSARLSPKSRGVVDLEDRVTRLSRYEQWRQPTNIQIEKIVDAELWKRHETNWRTVLDLLKESQKLAKEIRGAIERAQLTH
jgi:hypothetical protein